MEVQLGTLGLELRPGDPGHRAFDPGKLRLQCLCHRKLATLRSRLCVSHRRMRIRFLTAERVR
jgi:hypothetical protein